MSDDPFSTWGSHLDQAQLNLAAQKVANDRLAELKARRDYNEAISYFSGGQSIADGMDAEKLDKLLRQLAQTQDEAKLQRQQSEASLKDLIKSSPRHLPKHASDWEDLIKSAQIRILQDQELTTPSPLDDLIKSYRILRRPPDECEEDIDTLPLRRSPRR